MKKKNLFWLTAFIFNFVISSVAHAYIIQTYPGDGFPYTDTELGINGLNFEDITLAPGLTLSLVTIQLKARSLLNQVT